MFVPSFILIERGLDGAQYFILNKIPVLLENQCIPMFRCLLPKTSSCASKPSKLLCKLVIRQFLFHVSLGLKEVQVGAHDFKLNMVLRFVLENQGISMFRGLLHRN